GKVWWSEGEDLVLSLVAPDGADAIIAALDGGEPNVLAHPARAALSRGADEPGFVPVGLAFCEMAAFPSLPREARAFGLDKVKRIDYRWGFHGPAIEGIIGVVAPALFDQPTFDTKHLPPLPGGLDGFTVVSLDAARTYDRVVASLGVVDGAADAFRKAADEVAGL